jgi:hypothetical protein
MALGTTNISMALVNTTLGVSINALASLCVSTAINRWAKYKPIASPYVVMSWAEFQAECSRLNFGLTCQTSTNPITAGGYAWTYTKPTSNYRLGDFRGYEHYATAPVVGIGNISINATNQPQITVMPEMGGGTNAVNLADIQALQSSYLALVIRIGSTTLIKTDNNTLANPTGVVLNYNELAAYPTGDYTYYLVASSVKQTTLSAAPSATYRPLPFATAAEASGVLKYYTSAIEMEVSDIGNSLAGLAPIENYSPAMGTTYLTAPTNGDFYFRARVYNRSTQAMSFSRGAVTVQGQPSLAAPFSSGSVTGYCSLGGMYNNSSSTNQASITIPADSYVDIRFYVSGFWLFKNGTQGSMAAGVTTVGELSIKYNTVEVAQSEQFNLKTN